MKPSFALASSMAFAALLITAGCASRSDGNQPSALRVTHAALDGAAVCPGAWAYQLYVSPCYANAPSWDCSGSFHETCYQYQTCSNPAFGIKDYVGKQGSFSIKGTPELDCSSSNAVAAVAPQAKPICTKLCDFTGVDTITPAINLKQAWGGASYTTPVCGAGTYAACNATCTTTIAVPEYNSQAAYPCASTPYECGFERSCRTASNGLDSNPKACGGQNWMFSTTGLSHDQLLAQLPSGQVADTYCTTPIAGNANLAAVRTVYDSNDHAFVALTGGDIREIWYQAENGTVGNASISNHPDVVAIAAFNALEPAGSASVDRVHVIVATQSGDLYDIYYQPQKGVQEYQLGHVDTGGSPIIAMSAWADAAGAPTYQTVAILAQNGNLYALSYTDVIALPTAQPPVLVTQTSATAMTGYSADGVNHLIILDTDLIDISWSVGRAPDLNDTMTQVNTLRSADAAQATIVALAGAGMSSPTTFSPNGSDHLALLLGSATPKLDELIFSRPGTVSPLLDVTALSGVPVSVAAYVATGDTTQHFVTLTSQGALVDYRQLASGTSWTAFPLGTF